MSVLAIIAALLIEQWRPLGERKAVAGVLASGAAWLEQSFNGGERRHGVVAWLVAVLPAVAGGVAAPFLVLPMGAGVALLFHVPLPYLTLRLPPFRPFFTP